MKHPKPQSLTTDTRLSQSNFFNSSLLQKTNMTTTSKKQPYNNLTLSNTFNHNNSTNNNKNNQQFSNTNNKQIDFLKVKNIQLQQRVKRMSDEIKKLEDNKIHLLKLNQKYVKVVNQYYSNQNININKNINKSINKSINQTRTSQKNIKMSEDYIKRQSICNKSKYSSVYEQPTSSCNAEIVLTDLQKDYRNLVKHCLVMQNQIKNYAQQMQKFTQMKSQLYAVNHTTPKQLIFQLQQSTFENKQLKKQNNRLTYQLQKSRQQNNKLKKSRDTQNKQLNSNNQQAEKLKAEIIKITQQSTDKTNQDKQTIYELQLKVEKLQKQLRSGQQFVMKNQQKRKQLEIQRVENVHQNNFLRANLSQLLDPKKHPLLSLDRSFVYKKKKQPKKRISLHSSIRE